MQYKGESCNWNWDKHCAKFHQQLAIIDEWAVARMAPHMSNEDQISAFLKTIPKDCKNGELVITKGIIERDRSCFPTLVGNVIPMLSPTINTKEHGVPVPKRMIANANICSRSCDRSGKSCQTGCPRTTTGKCRIDGGKVVGTIEGLHYEEDTWNVMSPMQKVEVVHL